MDLKSLFTEITLQPSNFELNTSVDCVIFTIQDETLKALLTRFANKIGWMLPGGFIAKYENSDSAAKRILQERTGIDNIYMQQFKIFSDPDRFSFEELFNISDIKKNKHKLPKLPERVFSIGYFALVNYEQTKVTGGMYKEESNWLDIKNLPQLAFDHNEIISEAAKALRKEIHFKPIGYNLLPEKFTMPELQKLYEIILDRKLDRSSFQRKMLNWDIYERQKERKEGVAHKRPFLYKFDLTKYKQASERGVNFGI